MLVFSDSVIFRDLTIPINSDFRENVNTMCNLAEGIEERTQKVASINETRYSR